MTDRFWRDAPWWLATIAAVLALLDLQFGIVGRALYVAALAIGVAGILAAPLIDALLLAVAVSLFPGDAALLAVTLCLLYRMVFRGTLFFDSSFRSMLLTGFFVSAAGSAVFGMIAVEPRPMQWLVWMVTVAAPLLLLAGGFRRIPARLAPRLSRFLLFVVWVQVPVCAAQLIRHGDLEPGDWFAGVWSNANLVGIWGSVTLAVFVVRLLTKTIDAKGSRARVAACGHAAVGLFLVWGASAKLYSACVFGAAGLVIVILLIRGTPVSRAGLALRSGIAIFATVLAGALAQSWVQDNYEGLISNWEYSEKQVFLTRVVLGVTERYNSILGVGPGMLGSRAASAASADVLFKNAGTAVASFLGPSPKPERWAMVGLWNVEAAQGVTDKSALLTMPFSGWGSVRAELGWPAAILLALYLLSLGQQMASIAARHRDMRGLGFAASVGCLALLPMLVFDNILEQPQIMGPLVILVIVVRSIALRSDHDAPALTDEAMESDSRLVERPTAQSATGRGFL